MIKFLFKGILRDRSRSILPIIIVSIGVALTVLLSGYMTGVFGDVINQSAIFETGHVKVMSRAYADNYDQLPNDLALLGVDEIMNSLKSEYGEVEWVKRIKFGGLIDVLDEAGESVGQGPVAGLSFEIYSGDGSEVERLNMEASLVSGTIPKKPKDAIISHKFAQKLGLEIGDEVTYVGSTMNGSMAFSVFNICGTISFGMPAMDNGTIILDVSDVQRILDMEDGAAEILGFLPNDTYFEDQTIAMSEEFNKKYESDTDEFAPVMVPLREQSDLGSMIDFANGMSAIFVILFIIAMSVVLWNTGLLAGIRRYKEFGIRLALGETKSHIFKTFTYEAIVIGLIGSVVGTLIGLAGVYYLQVVGLDISGMMDQLDTSMMLPTVLRSKVTPQLFVIGFIPGTFAMVLGNMLSGRGIYKRQTASLFKELEV
jgi:putative ABC transport system permease protein